MAEQATASVITLVGANTLPIDGLSLQDSRGYVGDTCSFTFRVSASNPPSYAPTYLRQFGRSILVSVRLDDKNFGAFQVQRLSDQRNNDEHRVTANAVRLSDNAARDKALQNLLGSPLARLDLHDKFDDITWATGITTADYIRGQVLEAKGFEGKKQVLNNFGIIIYYDRSDSAYRLQTMDSLFDSTLTSVQRSNALNISKDSISYSIPDIGIRQDIDAILNLMGASVKSATGNNSRLVNFDDTAFLNPSIVLQGDFPHLQGAQARMVGEAINRAYQAESATCTIDWTPAIDVDDIVRHGDIFFRVVQAVHNWNTPSTSLTLIPADGFYKAGYTPPADDEDDGVDTGIPGLQ